MKKEIVAKCPHCHEEISLMWDTEERGLEIRCVYCGELVMLCGECEKVRNGGCDWDGAYHCCSKSRSKIAEEKKKSAIRQSAYERFKLWWMLTHGYTVNDLYELTYRYINELKDGHEGTLDECVQTTGFDGCIWPCFNEFVDGEYQNTTLMFTLMNAEEYQEYLNAEGFEEPDHLGDTIKVNTPHGEIVAYDNNDPEYPGISLFFVPKGSDREGPGGVMEFTPNYSPNESCEFVTDKVWFRFYGKENPYSEPTNTFAME